MAQAEPKSTNWLSIVKDVFPRWRDRLGSTKDAIAELEDLLCDPDTRSAKRRVDASGEEIPGTSSFLDHSFWQSVRLSPVPDADGGSDDMVVDYADHTDIYSPDGHWEFFVRRVDVEREEQRLYFPPIAAPPPTPEIVPDTPTPQPALNESAAPEKPKAWLPAEHKRRKQLDDIPKDITTYGLELHKAAVEAVRQERLTNAPTARRFETLLHDLGLFPKVKRRTQHARITRGRTHD